MYSLEHAPSCERLQALKDRIGLDHPMTLSQGEACLRLVVRNSVDLVGAVKVQADGLVLFFGIDPDLQGRGLGKLLWTLLLGTASAKGIDHLWGTAPWSATSWLQAQGATLGLVQEDSVEFSFSIPRV